jgi:hypothetical protein
MGRFKRSLHACVVSGFLVHVQLRCTSSDMGARRRLGGEGDMGLRDAPLGRRRMADGLLRDKHGMHLSTALWSRLNSVHVHQLNL